MPFLTWSAEYSMGIWWEMDEQHKKLIALINELHETQSTGDAPEVAEGVLNELVTRTYEHFAAEEDLMRAGGYPDLDAHIQLHQDLVNEIEDLQHAEDYGSTAASARLPEFLRDWLVKHILDEDMKYARFFTQQKAKPVTPAGVTARDR